MKYILILLVSFTFGQAPKPLAGIEGVWSIVNGDSTFMFNGDTGKNPNYAKRMWRNFYNKIPITMGMIFEYAKECYNDTLRLEKYDHYGNDYILVHENYAEMFTELQLKQKGYFYQYRWVTNTVIDEEHPMKMEYIFVKEPTMKGFTEWLKK